VTKTSTKLIVNGSGAFCFENKIYPCALGHGGRRVDKAEGDGASPVGTWPLRKVFFRPDRLAAPACKLPVTTLSPGDGWCDDPEHVDYNKLVALPHEASCETLWREDHVYDIIVILGHNAEPVVPGAGSAIFFHLARKNYDPTEGCVALALDDMLEVLAKISVDCTLEIMPATP
jgi:L,D-peptidoglycan transpeptidase YkuD (ErfK/YbiS/YcfS/YnhG family)